MANSILYDRNMFCINTYLSVCMCVQHYTCIFNMEAKFKKSGVFLSTTFGRYLFLCEQIINECTVFLHWGVVCMFCISLRLQKYCNHFSNVLDCTAHNPEKVEDATTKQKNNYQYLWIDNEKIPNSVFI